MTVPPTAWPMFLDPLALAIVGGGTLVGMALRGPGRDLGNAFRALTRLWRPGIDVDRCRAEIARAERVAVTRGLLNVDVDAIPDATVRAALREIVDGAGPERIAPVIEAEEDGRARRHAVAQGVWAGAAELAPAMGMIGTLVGLVRMFSRMDDPAAIGGAMAVALLTTLYGAIVANLVAAPIAARLQRLSAEERAGRASLVAPLQDFARRAAPRPLRQPGRAA